MKPTNNIQPANRVKAYAVSIFDGVFPSEQIENKRNMVFYRIANFQSPKTGKKLSEVLSEEQIGEIINELDTLQFNRRLQSKIARAGEAQF